MVFYAINFAAQNWNQLKGLRPLTIFNYYSPADAINLGRLDVGAVLVLIGLALVTTAAAAAIFRLWDLSSWAGLAVLLTAVAGGQLGERVR